MRWSTPPQWLVVIRPLGHVADDVVPELTKVLEEELSGTPTRKVSLEDHVTQYRDNFFMKGRPAQRHCPPLELLLGIAIRHRFLWCQVTEG